MFFLVWREMFSEPPDLIINRYQEKCYASGLTLEHVRWHYNDYTIQKKKNCICLENCYVGHDMCIGDISLCAVSLSLSSQMCRWFTLVNSMLSNWDDVRGHFCTITHRIHGIYANMTGVYWWDPCYHIQHTWILWVIMSGNNHHPRTLVS